MHRGGAAAARTLGRLSLRQAAPAHVASGSSDSCVAGSTLLRRLSSSVAEQASSPKGQADSGTKNLYLLWGTASVATVASAVVTAAATVAVMVRYIWRVCSKYVCVGTQLDPACTRLQDRLWRLILRHSIV